MTLDSIKNERKDQMVYCILDCATFSQVGDSVEMMDTIWNLYKKFFDIGTFDEGFNRFIEGYLLKNCTSKVKSALYEEFVYQRQSDAIIEDYFN